jgi:malate synthase
VAHPGLVPLAREVFDAAMKGPHQIDNKRLDVEVSAADLIQVPAGTRTEAGLRRNIDVGIQYLASWLAGNGCVPIYHLMEDAATAEISRTQVWQWLSHGARLDDGRPVTRDLVLDLVREETEGMRSRLGAEAFARLPFAAARDLFVELTLSPTLTDFLTIPAYDRLQE